MAKQKKKLSLESKDADDLKQLLESDKVEPVSEYVSTGSTLLDYAISNQPNGGVPVGRITELIGENQAGKTLIGTHILANTQKKGGIAICCDLEHDIDKGFSFRIGLDWDKLIYKEYLGSLEEVFEYLEKVITTTRLKYKDKLITIMWDSIAATPAAAELEAGYDPTKLMGLHARIMSGSLRKIRSMIKSERIALVCTNQLREKIGVVFGKPTTTAHGKAMSFYSSVRVELKKMKQIKESSGRVTGAVCRAEVVKNKCGPPWRSVLFPVMYDWGIDDATSILDCLIDMQVIKGGAWKSIDYPSDVEPIKFRTNEWTEILKKRPEIKKYVLNKLNDYMIIKFDTIKDDFIVDMDSILEPEGDENLK